MGILRKHPQRAHHVNLSAACRHQHLFIPGLGRRHLGKCVHVDFIDPFEERMILVAIDAHSKWPEVLIMRSTTAGKTIEQLGAIFSRFQLVSTNGPQFILQDFMRFLEANRVQHIRSAPYHISTNGVAERFVQSMKHAIKASQGEGSLH